MNLYHLRDLSEVKFPPILKKCGWPKDAEKTAIRLPRKKKYKQNKPVYFPAEEKHYISRCTVSVVCWQGEGAWHPSVKIILGVPRLYEGCQNSCSTKPRDAKAFTGFC